MYFFDPDQGARRREAALRWFEQKAEAVLRRSHDVGGAPAEVPFRQPAAAPQAAAAEQPAAAPPPDVGSEDDLASTLQREVTYVTVDAGGTPPEEEPATAAVGAPPRATAVTYDEGSATPAPSFVHVEAAAPRPSPRIISYDEPPAAEDEPEVAIAPQVVETQQRRGRWRLVLAAATAAALGVGAAALGAWAIWPEEEATQAAQVEPGAAQAIELISQPGAQSVPVDGSNGTMVLVVAPNGEAVLIVSGLQRAPAGKVYQAWIVHGPKPKSAGLFRGGETRLVIPLGRKVPKGAIVAVTVERAGGAPAPTQTPKYVAKLS